MGEAVTVITAKCPSCRVDTLDVQVGRKSTTRTTSCRLCGNRYEYSCWVLTTGPGGTFHQVDLFPVVERRAV
jgi:hypothetical protein